MDYLSEKKVVDGGDIAAVAINQLAFAGKPELNTANLRDAVGLEEIAVGSPKRAPVGQYAVEALENAGNYSRIEKLVTTRDVRECISFVDRREVNGAFVYRADADRTAKHPAVLVTVPQGLYPRVAYLAAVTAAVSRKPDALACYRFLQSQEAKMILSKYGFPVK